MTWLLFASTVVAPMRFATKRWRSGCTVRSAFATMNQLGFDFQAAPCRPAVAARCVRARRAARLPYRLRYKCRCHDITNVLASGSRK